MLEKILSQINYLEALGAGLAIVQVILSKNNNVNNYLFGIAGILIAIWIYYHNKLYADILLNLYYLIMSIYGWFFWKFGKKSKQSPITYSSPENWLIAFGIVSGCLILMFYWLNFHTDSDVPVWDSFVVAFAWAGMWLMAKRKIENWLFLNMSNLIAIPLMVYKGLYIYAALTVFLFIMGWLGYFNWRKIYKQTDGNFSNQKKNI